MIPQRPCRARLRERALAWSSAARDSHSNLRASPVTIWFARAPSPSSVEARTLGAVLSHPRGGARWTRRRGTLPSGGHGAHPQAFVNGFSTRDASRDDHGSGRRAGTAMLLIPDRGPGPISHTVEQELPQFVGEK
jgi:hypothetical protein